MEVRLKLLVLMPRVACGLLLVVSRPKLLLLLLSVRNLAINRGHLEVDPLKIFDELIQARCVNLTLKLDLVGHLKQLWDVRLQAGSLKFVIVGCIEGEELSFI